jgi:hypothetical protein
MVPIFDPGNIMVLLMLSVVLCIPRSILTTLIFFTIGQIPSRVAQGLIPLIVGILFVVTSRSMEPPTQNTPQTLMTFIGILLHPLLILSPVAFLQKYLHRIPVTYAVFFTALISLFVFVTMGTLQGDLRYIDINGFQFIREVIVTVSKNLFIASIAFGIIIGLDSFLFSTEENTL